MILKVERSIAPNQSVFKKKTSHVLKPKPTEYSVFFCWNIATRSKYMSKE